MGRDLISNWLIDKGYLLATNMTAHDLLRSPMTTCVSKEIISRSQFNLLHRQSFNRNRLMHSIKIVRLRPNRGLLCIILDHGIHMYVSNMGTARNSTHVM